MRIFMTNKEKLRKAVIEACLEGKLTNEEASNKLRCTVRNIKKLKQNYRKKGEEVFIHGNCGRQPVSTIDANLRSKIVQLKQSEKYKETNITHFTEVLERDEGIKLSYSTVYRILSEKNIKSPRKHKKPRVHARRERLSKAGQMLQMDGTPYEFFKGDPCQYSLHGFIDDATGCITGLYMCKNECLQGYLEVLRQTLRTYGSPQMIYADGTSIMFNNIKKEVSIKDQLAGICEYTTQFDKILDEFGIEPIRANSPQAKGRIERLWNTLHDRLRNEFTINGISSIEAANAFLPKFISYYNNKFGKKPKDSNSAFVPLPKGINLDLILTARVTRTPDVSNTISIKKQLFKIDCREILHKKKVDILISKKIGMKALYNGKLYPLIPIIENSSSLERVDSDSTDNIIQNFIFYYCFSSVKALKPIEV